MRELRPDDLPVKAILLLAMAKELTREQAAARQDKAVEFTERVRDDPERAAQIADMSVERYAEERGFKIVNPAARKRRKMLMPKSRAELIEENRALEDQLAAAEDRLAQIADLAEAEEEDEEEEA